MVNVFFTISESFTKELISNSVAYVNREVQESGHPLHCDSGVIFGHYSDVLGK